MQKWGTHVGDDLGDDEQPLGEVAGGVYGKLLLGWVVMEGFGSPSAED